MKLLFRALSISALSCALAAVVSKLLGAHNGVIVLLWSVGMLSSAIVLMASNSERDHEIRSVDFIACGGAVLLLLAVIVRW